MSSVKCPTRRRISIRPFFKDNVQCSKLSSPLATTTTIYIIYIYINDKLWLWLLSKRLHVNICLSKTKKLSMSCHIHTHTLEWNCTQDRGLRFPKLLFPFWYDDVIIAILYMTLMFTSIYNKSMHVGVYFFTK